MGAILKELYFYFDHPIAVKERVLNSQSIGLWILVMGLGQKFGNFPHKIPNVSVFVLQVKKSVIGSGRKVPGTEPGRPLIYCMFGAHLYMDTRSQTDTRHFRDIKDQGFTLALRCSAF